MLRKKTKSPERNRRIKIIPSILVKNKTEFVRAWKKLSPYFKHLQIDIMSRDFVGTKSCIYPSTIQNYIRGHNIEIHLMVKDVQKHITRWEQVKNVKKIIWHYEADTNKNNILKINKFLKSKKIKTGLAINPNTPLYKIKDLIKYFDTIQLMAVTPGKQGQKFQPKVLKKIHDLRSKYKNLNIEVDGAVNEKTFPAIKKAGANIVCPGSYFQSSKNIKESLKKLPA